MSVSLMAGEWVLEELTPLVVTTMEELFCANSVRLKGRSISNSESSNTPLVLVTTGVGQANSIMPVVDEHAVVEDA